MSEFFKDDHIAQVRETFFEIAQNDNCLYTQMRTHLRNVNIIFLNYQLYFLYYLYIKFVTLPYNF